MADTLDFSGQATAVEDAPTSDNSLAPDTTIDFSKDAIPVPDTVPPQSQFRKDLGNFLTGLNPLNAPRIIRQDADSIGLNRGIINIPPKIAPASDTTMQKVGTGLRNVGTGAVNMLSSPGGAALAIMSGGEGLLPKLIASGFFATMAPPAAKKLYDGIKSGDPQAITEGTAALAMAGTAGARAAGVPIRLPEAFKGNTPVEAAQAQEAGAAATRGPVQGPPALGLMIKPPAGAVPDADLADVVNQSRVPKQGIPAPPIEQVPRPARAKPVVPETPPEPEKVAYSSMLDEIRKRGLISNQPQNQLVRAIQKVFPQLSQQQAYELLREAKGAPKLKPPEPTAPVPVPPAATQPQAQPGTPPEPPAPVPTPAPTPPRAPVVAAAPSVPEAKLGVWPESEWNLDNLKKQTVKQRQDKAKFLGLRSKEGLPETGFKKLADAAQKRIAELKAPKPAPEPEVAPAETKLPEPATVEPVPETKPAPAETPASAAASGFRMGPGAQTAGEIPATDLRGQPSNPTVGVAARVLEQEAHRGALSEVIEPGTGVGVEEAIQHGRNLLKSGVDPEATMANMEKTKRFNFDDAAVLRAHIENLSKAMYDANDRFGPNSEQTEAAMEQYTDFQKRYKALSTEWHKIGQGLQGETEVDTGTFIGMRKAFRDLTGKDLTEGQAEKVRKIVKGVQDADKAVETAKKKLVTEADKVPGTAPDGTDLAASRKQFGDFKPGTPMTPQQVKTLWNYAKSKYLDKFETDFNHIREGLATDFGLSKADVTKGLAQPRAIKTITDDMYKKLADARQLKTEAKNWLKDQATPGWLRAIKRVPRAFFAAATFGHGTVGPITHAVVNLFHPGRAKIWVQNFGRGFKLMTDSGYHEQMMSDLERDPLYIKARRAGLVNDPWKYKDDYQNNEAVKLFKKLGLAGNRGFDALKLMRQDLFNKYWKALPDTLQTTEQSKLLANEINHSTGAVNMQLPELANWTFFAPKLEVSRWAWMVKDPAIAAKTLADWKNSSVEARHQAISEIKQKATIVGTYLGLLSLNQAILSATGSKQQVNFTNPRKADFLSFKIAGHNVGVAGPMLGIVRLFANMIHASMGQRGKLESLDSRSDEMGKIATEYGRNKLSPVASFGADVASQADYQGRPLPFSNDKTPAYLRREGIGPYTYPEYAATRFTPIPVSEAVLEIWKDQGMNDDDISKYLNALLTGAAAGATGARITIDTTK